MTWLNYISSPTSQIAGSSRLALIVSYTSSIFSVTVTRRREHSLAKKGSKHGIRDRALYSSYYKGKGESEVII